MVKLVLHQMGRLIHRHLSFGQGTAFGTRCRRDQSDPSLGSARPQVAVPEVCTDDEEGGKAFSPGGPLELELTAAVFR